MKFFAAICAGSAGIYLCTWLALGDRAIALPGGALAFAVIGCLESNIGRGKWLAIPLALSVHFASAGVLWLASAILDKM